MYTFLGSYTKSLDSFFIKKKSFVMAFMTILIKSTNPFFINDVTVNVCVLLVQPKSEKPSHTTTKIH